MRPTRFTRKQRVTKPRRGGWQMSVYPFYIMYMHPVTGSAFVGTTPWSVWKMRKAVEEKKERDKYLHMTVKGVTHEP
jgi:hypothetical protein